MTTDRPIVAVIVGTDHHPFNRLVRWCDEFAADHPDVDVRIQYGSASPPTHADGSSLWTKEQLYDIVAAAHTVVSHGGPGTISDIRSGGTWPVVLPRSPALGEHVDAHQMRFVERVASTGLVEPVWDESSLHAIILRRLSLPRDSGLESSIDAQQVSATVQRFTELVAGLPHKRGFLPLRRRQAE